MASANQTRPVDEAVQIMAIPEYDVVADTHKLGARYAGQTLLCGVGGVCWLCPNHGSASET